MFVRDESRCRACQRKVRYRTDSPLALGHVHHIIRRSAGGTDELSNLALLCAFCHEDCHGTGVLECEGNGNETLLFRRRTTKRDGDDIKVWGSQCPN